MEDGSFVYVDLVGKIADSGEIFETTKENVARESGIFNPNLTYKPQLAIIGSGHLIPGLENALKAMQVGERKIIELQAKDAFGERREELVRLFNLSTLRNYGIDPVPGTTAAIGGLPARIMSVSGGRVKVDFNHPLAGKAITYEVEIKGEIKDANEKIAAILCHYSGLDKDRFSIKIGESVAEIEIRGDIAPEIKRSISGIIKRWVGGIEKVKFISYF